MLKVAVFTGSFDPFHLGHQDVAQRAANFFDQLVIVIGVHHVKKPLYSINDRKVMIERAMHDYDNVKVTDYDGVLTDFVLEYVEECSEEGLSTYPVFIRGLRHEGDFRYEAGLAYANKKITENFLETMFIMTDPAYTHISSTMVREILEYKKDSQHLLPKEVHDIIEYRDMHPNSYLFDNETKILGS